MKKKNRGKKIGWIAGMVAAGLISFYTLTLQATEVTILWDKSPDDTVAYNIYFRLGDNPYTKTNSIKTTLTKYILELDGDGKWSIVVTGEDKSGNESGYSNEISTVVDTIPPMVPGMLRFEEKEL